MNNMIGKSGKDWGRAPEGATHVYVELFYRFRDDSWEYFSDDRSSWVKSQNADTWNNEKLISKEEDLEMNKKIVSSIKDLEVGMFLESISNTYVVTSIQDGTFTVVVLVNGNYHYDKQRLESFKSWSYTYNGEYTPIVKEDPKDLKIRELENTIAEATKQIQELKQI
jgi:hypothetical protein